MARVMSWHASLHVTLVMRIIEIDGIDNIDFNKGNPPPCYGAKLCLIRLPSFSIINMWTPTVSYLICMGDRSGEWWTRDGISKSWIAPSQEPVSGQRSCPTLFKKMFEFWVESCNESDPRKSCQNNTPVLVISSTIHTKGAADHNFYPKAGGRPSILSIYIDIDMHRGYTVIEIQYPVSISFQKSVVDNRSWYSSTYRYGIEYWVMLKV